MKSWKTTVGGILLGIGTPLMQSGVGIYHQIGVACATLGGIIIGISARDKDVSSEQQGIKPAVVPSTPTQPS